LQFAFELLLIPTNSLNEHLQTAYHDRAYISALQACSARVTAAAAAEVVAASQLCAGDDIDVSNEPEAKLVSSLTDRRSPSIEQAAHAAQSDISSRLNGSTQAMSTDPPRSIPNAFPAELKSRNRKRARPPAVGVGHAPAESGPPLTPPAFAAPAMFRADVAKRSRLADDQELKRYGLAEDGVAFAGE